MPGKNKPTIKRSPLFYAKVFCGCIFLGLFAGSAIALRMPIITGHTRLLFVSTAAIGILCGFLFLIRYPRLLIPTVSLFVLFAAWVCLGGRPVDMSKLRAEYVNQLASFRNCRYVWGGETHAGIDCSGLARVALWRAMLVEGIRERNPRLLGPTLWKFWWNDVTAQNLVDRKYGYTRIIGRTSELAGYDTDRLKDGDFAVLSGSHVIVYHENGKWIDASPGDGKVVTNKAPADSKRGWFKCPAVFLRWWVLDDKLKRS